MASRWWIPVAFTLGFVVGTYVTGALAMSAILEPLRSK
jgi:hypothetical protein